MHLRDITAGEMQVDIKEVYYLENIEQLQTISDPLRYSMLVMLTPTPMTGAQLARAFNVSRAKAHYHLKLLEKVGLVKFCWEKLSVSGITEKYYHAVARMFDFSKLLPPSDQAILSNEVTLQTFKVMSDFLVTMLDVSRESIIKSKGTASLATGIYFDFACIITPEQVEYVKGEIANLKQRIIAMTRENEDHTAGAPLAVYKFRTTLFLTLLSDLFEYPGSLIDSENHPADG